MWEIEHNPDILDLDKDPAAEAFLCDMYEVVKPSSKIPEAADATLLEKTADVENAEITDIEGIMNLEECEWNEIFTIEEQEIHNNVPPDGQLAGTDAPAAHHNKSLATTDHVLSMVAASVGAGDQSQYLRALHSNCRVIVKRLSADVIASSLNGHIPHDNNISKKSLKRSLSCQSGTIENKSKKIDIKNETLNGKIEKSVNATAEQRNFKPLVTINKNLLNPYRIIDAITIDSDDNQSCIIVNPVKSKVEKTEADLKMRQKTKSKLMKSLVKVGAAEVKVGEPSDRHVIGPKSKKGKLKHLKLDKSTTKNEWVNKNAKDMSKLTFEKLFNKNFSILGSGLKISKKVRSYENCSEDKVEETDNWTELKNKVETNVTKANDGIDDDAEGEWPKVKQNYDDFSSWNNKTNVDDAADDDDDGGGGGGGEFGGIEDDDDLDELWPKAKEYPEDTTIQMEGNENVEGSDPATESAPKWDDNNDESENNKSKNQEERKDPWSNYLSKKQVIVQPGDIKLELVSEDEDDEVPVKPKRKSKGKTKQLTNEVIEIEDNSNDGVAGIADIIVKDEDVNPPKKSSGNVWSHIQEIQSQMAVANDNVMPFVDSIDNVDINQVDEALKNMNYIQDAKWLNSRNEDFLDDTDYMDPNEMEEHGKWFNNDRESDSPPGYSVTDMMDNSNNISNVGGGGGNRNIESFTTAESWVDSAPFKSYRGSFNNNRGRDGRDCRNQPASNSRSQFLSPNQKPSQYKNIQMDQLFPPFKKEYFKNNRPNNFPKSPEMSPDWRGGKTNCKPVPLMSVGFPKMPMPMSMPARQVAPRNKGSQYGPAMPYQYQYGDMTGAYHEPSMKDMSANYPPYNYYGDAFSMMPPNYPPYFPPSFNGVPITPQSPDPSTEEPDIGSINKQQVTGADMTNCGTSGLTDPRLKSSVKPSTAPDRAPFLPYDKMPPYYYPLYGHPFASQYNPYTMQFDPIPYTPASPDPEDTCPASPPQEQPSQISQSN